MRQNLLMERKYASIVGMFCSRNGINSWKVHQLVGMLHNSNRKMASTIGTCINCWNGDLKVPQHLEGASNVGMWHQHLEGASNVRMETDLSFEMETDASLGLETDLRGFKF